MKNSKNYFAVLFAVALFTVSCSEENIVLQDEPEQELSAVPLLSNCGNLTTGDPAENFVVTAGNTVNLTKYRNPYSFELPINPDTGFKYKKSDVVGMGTDGHPNLHFVWYKNHKYSAGTSDDLDSARKPFNHTYELPINPQTGFRYKPEDIVGMAIDGENNWVFAWYKNGFASAGTPRDLGKHRNPYHFDLAINPRNGKEFRPDQIRAIAMDGKLNRTIVFYQFGFVSEGKSWDLDYYTIQNGGQAYCIQKRPAVNIKPKHFLGAGIDYTNQHVFIWSKAPQ